MCFAVEHTIPAAYELILHITIDAHIIKASLLLFNTTIKAPPLLSNTFELKDN